MMDDKVMRSLSAVITSFVCGALVACAGGDAPEVDDQLGDAIKQAYVPGAGGAPTGNAGGSTSTRGGRGGSSSRPPEDDPSPSAGRGGAGGTANSAECNGFAVLKSRCDGGSCHGAGTLNGNFAESAEIAEGFVGQDPVTSVCSSNGPLLNPDNPANSLLILKVNGTVPCGLPMPLGGTLEDSDIDCLEEWIGSL